MKHLPLEFQGRFSFSESEYTLKWVRSSKTTYYLVNIRLLTIHVGRGLLNMW